MNRDNIMQRKIHLKPIILLLLCTEVISFNTVRKVVVRKAFSPPVVTKLPNSIAVPTLPTSAAPITASSSSSSSPSKTQLYVAKERRSSDTRNNYASSNNNKRKETHTEISRLKFMLNQLKGNMKESELRATAAERRVAMLQAQIAQELKAGQSQIDGEKEEAAKAEAEAEKKKKEEEDAKRELGFLNQIKALKGTIKSINATMDSFKKQSTKEMEELKKNYGNDQTEWKQQMDKLQSDLDAAAADLTTAHEEAQLLQKEIKAVENRMEMRELELKTEAKKDVDEVKKEAQKAQFALEMEKELLKEKLMASKEQSENLIKDLEATKVEMTKEIVAIRTEAMEKLDKSEREVEKKKVEIQSKQELIAVLVTERKSVRKMFKVQRYLIKSRIKARMRRIFRRKE